VVLTILKNIKVNGKDYPIYDGKIKHVPNHQPVYIYYGIIIESMEYYGLLNGNIC